MQRALVLYLIHLQLHLNYLQMRVLLQVWLACFFTLSVVEKEH